MPNNDSNNYVEIQFLLGTETGKAPPEEFVERLLLESRLSQREPLDLIDEVLRSEQATLREKYGPQSAAYILSAGHRDSSPPV